MSDAVSVLEDVAKGAAMGAPFGGPIGAAIGGLGGVVAHFAPSLLSDLFGQPEAKAVQLASAAVQVVQQITGTADPDKAMAAAADPAVETQLRIQLAQISGDVRKAELAAQTQQASEGVAKLQAALADVADARKTMATLASSSSRLAWMPAVVTFLVLGGFFLIAALVLLRQLQENSMLFGCLTTMASAVVAYWVGTTNSAAASARQFVDMANKAADGVPAEIAHKLLPAPAATLVRPPEAAVAPFLQELRR